ncbi:MAG: hypothetical protein KBG17_07675 [Paludibacteraceae bacterium]|jgi:hypothetical protein|nr:hypothetical protein [Paludibacteraceae bacterium]
MIKNPKGSHVYSNELTSIYTTPSASHIFHFGAFYKHQIPSGLNTKPTQKGSNVYRTDIAGFYTTPLGSNNIPIINFYKPEIPSGLNTKQYAAK